jgi:hypothetical protein
MTASLVAEPEVNVKKRASHLAPSSGCLLIVYIQGQAVGVEPYS